MDTNNLDKWWYGLPENTRQAIGNDGIWEKLDMPSRSALHRYSRLRIYGTAKVEKPLNFDPFGHARFAHLFVLYD